jgi:hypothetical protein
MYTDYLLVGSLVIMAYMIYEMFKLERRIDSLADALLATMIGLKVTMDRAEDEDNERDKLSREQEERDY